MNRRTLATTLGLATFILAGSAGTAMAGGPSAGTSDTVTICHATRSLTHPYVTITISKSALDAHKKHQDRRDIIPAPAKGCPPSPDSPPPVDPYTGPFVPCVVSVGVLQTASIVTGTAADDTIDCTNASPGKWILGLDGNDTITGTAFDDTIIGGNGNDTITGGPGIDYIEGNAGNDTLTGSAGDDTLIAGSGNDTLSGGVGNDTLLAQPADAGADGLFGDADSDTCNAVTAEGDTLTTCEM
jgi:hypothetical protein